MWRRMSKASKYGTEANVLQGIRHGGLVEYNQCEGIMISNGICSNTPLTSSLLWHKLKIQLQKNPKYNQPGQINATPH
jgi:hypothetical protein